MIRWIDYGKDIYGYTAGGFRFRIRLLALASHDGYPSWGCHDAITDRLAVGSKAAVKAWCLLRLTEPANG